MHTFKQLSASYCTRLFIGLSLLAVSFIAPPAVAGYNQTNLVTNNQTNLTNSGYAPAANVDPNLVNPWGISRSATSPFWVSDNGTGVSTIYDGSGATIRSAVSIPGGNPTGQVFNGGSNFQVGPSQLPPAPARFIFATEAGIISGWNPAVKPNDAIAKVDNSASGANYKGLGIDNSNSMLYAANFGNGKIDAFDGSFQPAALTGSFTDPNLPAGYVPFNIQNLGGELFVTYAFKANPGDTDETAGSGLGIIDIFDTQGELIKRLINDKSVNDKSVLNAPWGLALAPPDFGEFSNDLLVGNFGDGRINAFDPMNGTFLGTLSDVKGSPIEIDGLWGLAFGNGGNGGRKDTLYFAAGINDEADGLFGSLSVPEPAALPMMILGLVVANSYKRRFTRKSGRLLFDPAVTA